METINKLISKKQIIELWTLPDRKPPSETTIWRLTQSGLIPKPIKIGNVNLYNKEEALRLREEAIKSKLSESKTLT